MNKYQSAQIYTIKTPQDDKYYIGSTITPLYIRLNGHRQKYKSYINGVHHYVSSFDIIKQPNHYIEILEIYPCNSKDELETREGQLIREHKLNIVNIAIPKRTHTERTNTLEYRTKHRANANMKVKCVIEGCNIEYSKANKSLHIKKYH